MEVDLVETLIDYLYCSFFCQSILTPPAQLPWKQASKLALDGASKAFRALGIDLRDQ